VVSGYAEDAVLFRRGLLGLALLGCSFDRGGRGGGGNLTGDAQIAVDARDVADSHVGGATNVDSAAETAGDAGCVGKPSDPCTSLPPLLGSQTLDGEDFEFCNIAGVDVDAKTAQYRPTPAATWTSGSMRVKVAWSDKGLHLHFHVNDTTFAPAPMYSEHWRGDCIELFVAGHNRLTGVFNGVNDRGAMQIIFARPQMDGSSRAGIFYGGYVTSEISKDIYDVSNRSDGWDLEVAIPWAMIAGTGIAPGSIVGLDFALNDRRDLTSTDADYMGYRLRMPLPVAWCGGMYCDDRVWCQPKLE
jgi:hypothetical protein